MSSLQDMVVAAIAGLGPYRLLMMLDSAAGTEDPSNMPRPRQDVLAPAKNAQQTLKMLERRWGGLGVPTQQRTLLVVSTP